MSDKKNQKTHASVIDFLNAVDNERRRMDGFSILEMMRDISGEDPAMWGPSIIGFGNYHYEYESGEREILP